MPQHAEYVLPIFARIYAVVQIVIGCEKKVLKPGESKFRY